MGEKDNATSSHRGWFLIVPCIFSISLLISYSLLQHRYSTAMFKISHRKLNDLGRQISGKPVDQAILQMVFSEKRASKRLKSMLCVARDHAVDYKGLDRDKLIVCECFPCCSLYPLELNIGAGQLKPGSRKALNSSESRSKDAAGAAFASTRTLGFASSCHTDKPTKSGYGRSIHTSLG